MMNFFKAFLGIRPAKKVPAQISVRRTEWYQDEDGPLRFRLLADDTSDLTWLEEGDPYGMKYKDETSGRKDMLEDASPLKGKIPEWNYSEEEILWDDHEEIQKKYNP